MPLDDCLYACRHAAASDAVVAARCLQRHGISRLAEIEGDKPGKRKFKAYPLGYFHKTNLKVRTQQGRLYLFVAIDRSLQVRLRLNCPEKATMRVAVDSWGQLIEVVLQAIPCLPTASSADLPKNR